MAALIPHGGRFPSRPQRRNGKPETRFTELRIEGTGQLSGILMRYGDTATFCHSARNGLSVGSFQFDDVILNSMHQREVPLARTGGGGLELQDSPDSLTMRAVLPDTAAARDTSDFSALWRSQGLVSGVSGPRGTSRR